MNYSVYWDGPGERDRDEPTGTEIIAHEIALFHGGAIIQGNSTVASLKGYGSFGWSPERYADRHWREYIGAAERMLERINQP